MLNSKELMNSASAGENFFKNIVTGDKTWVYGYDVKTKAQSLQWVSKNVTNTLKSLAILVQSKVMLTVFFLLWGHNS